MFLTRTMTLRSWYIALGMLVLTISAAQAADAKAGQLKAGMCVTCHGALGLSTMPNAPHLAGQPAIYVEEQLKQYRSGKRANEVMAVMAKPLTDKEIENLAAWYASIPIEVGQPR